MIEGEVITRLVCNEYSGGDDIAIRNFRFASVPNPVPSAMVLMGTGLISLIAFRGCQARGSGGINNKVFF